MKTKKLATASTRKTPIWVNMSALPLLRAELGGAAACRFHCAREPLGKLLLVEDLECRFGGAAFGGHIPAQSGGRVAARGGKLGRAKHGVQRKFHGSVPAQAQLLCRRGELLDEPEHVSRPARRDRGH